MRAAAFARDSAAVTEPPLRASSGSAAAPVNGAAPEKSGAECCEVRRLILEFAFSSMGPQTGGFSFQHCFLEFLQDPSRVNDIDGCVQAFDHGATVDLLLIVRSLGSETALVNCERVKSLMRLKVKARGIAPFGNPWNAPASRSENPIRVRMRGVQPKLHSLEDCVIDYRVPVPA